MILYNKIQHPPRFVKWWNEKIFIIFYFYTHQPSVLAGYAILGEKTYTKRRRPNARETKETEKRRSHKKARRKQRVLREG